MKHLTFKGGIHPPDGKSYTAGIPIKTIRPKAGSELIFPMSQHLGAPCEPVVAKGDRVLVGQKIAESQAFVSSPIHASESGTVKDIRQSLTPTGIKCNAVVIESDGLFEEMPMKPNPDYTGFKRENILDIIKNAGIVGLGGAGFPTHIKLNPPPDKKIDTIIVNAAECEPYLTSDHSSIIADAERLVCGLEIMLMLHPGAKGIIGVETNKQDAIEKLESICRDRSNVSVVHLHPKYPQGAEKQLIYACTEREVPSGGLPADIGCIVNNVDTVIAIERAVVRGRPLMRKIITVSGGAVNEPGNYKVRIGMTYRELMDAIGGFKTEPYKLISGGPMMGVAMFNLDVPIIKTSSAFLCLTREEAELPPEQNCIRCGRCVEICPMHLLPQELNLNILAADFDAFAKNNGLDCIECGSCSYICPAKRHLAQSIRATRRELLAKRKK